MALDPKNFSTKERLQPGGHGEPFLVDMPGYRENEERINRTNMYWNTGMHDVPNCEWEFDDRLPVLFRYGFAYGFNQMVLPKGRVVALDKAMNKIHWDTKKARNTMTLANGGVPVRLREASDLYKATEGTASEIVSPDMQGKNVLSAGKEWVPVVGMEKAYSKKAFRPFVDNSAEVAEGQDAALVTPSKQLADAGYKIDAVSGRVVDENGVVVDTVRDANIPIGVLENNQYTKDVDAYNGMMCGPVRTDAMITLPWFVFKDKAEGSYWGSIYGADVRPGALLKSDENGRLVVSPLSIDEELATMSAKEIELERRQVVGEVYSAVQELLPAGAAKWATWALADRLNYEYFNPTMWRETNRRGEDSTNQSPYATTGEYPGYPYDKAFTEHNLHMLGANLRNNNYNHRMDFEYLYSELGIPGLTDGFNAVVREFPEEKMGEIHFRGAAEGYLDQMFQTLRVDLEPGTLEVKLDVVAADGSVAAGNWVKAVVGQSLDATGAFALNYVSELQGVVKVQMAADKADAVLKDGSTAVLYARYQKRGLAGVPTFMDWDGCIGSVQVLLNK